MKISLITTFLLLLLASASSYADKKPFAIELDAYLWHSDASGSLKAPDFNNYQLKLDERTLRGESNGFFAATVEHGIPYLPAVRAAYTHISHSGSGNLTTTLAPPNDNIALTGEVDLSHYDLTAYYRLVDRLLTLDIGLTARLFDGQLQSDFVSATFDSVYALAYARGQVSLPLTGISTGVLVNAGDNGDERAIDFDGWLQYTSPFKLGVRLGYRFLDINLESTARAGSDRVALTTDFEINGPYLGLNYRF